MAVSARAQDAEQTVTTSQQRAPLGLGLIEAVVIDVQGTSLTLAGGIVIDISRAIIFSIGGERLDITIKPGMVIRANILASDPASSALVAQTIRVQPEDRLVFSGVLQEADLENGFIVLLDRRILLTGESFFPIGFKLRKLKAGLLVSVIVKPVGNDLVATLIFPNIVLPNIFP